MTTETSDATSVLPMARADFLPASPSVIDEAHSCTLVLKCQFAWFDSGAPGGRVQVCAAPALRAGRTKIEGPREKNWSRPDSSQFFSKFSQIELTLVSWLYRPMTEVPQKRS